MNDISISGIYFASRSERGLVRKNNQDNVVCLGELGVFAVADGMGGYAEGALASRMMCEALEQGVSADSGYQMRLDEIAAAVDAANGRIFAYAAKHGFRTVGTTLALLALDGTTSRRGTIGHIGDSRVYRVRSGRAELMTRDHSVGAELEESVGTAAGHSFAMRSNPLSHMLTRAIGISEKVQLEWRKIDVAVGDRFVVCSDGVHDVVGVAELLALVAEECVSDAAKALERAIVAHGAPDNYSFVIIEIGG